MTFLAPWAFFFAAIAPVIVLLYLLKLRRRTTRVSTLLFWNRVLEEKRRSALFQRLRNPLSLLLHLLIFALLLLALAKPVLDGAIREGTSTVVILDTRARMQAKSGGTLRFDEAKREAMTLLAQAGPLREFAVFAAGAETRVLSPLTADAGLLVKAVEAMTPSDAGGDLNAALKLADDVLASRAGTRRIVVLTGPLITPLPVPRSGADVDVRKFGFPVENTGITSFSARQLPGDPQSAEVLLEISRFGSSSAEGNVELRRDGTLLDVRPFRASPGEPAVIVFPTIVTSGTAADWLTAQLDRPDDFALDDVAYAALPGHDTKSVLLITRGNWFLEKLLAADRRIRFELLDPESFRAAMLDQFEVVIFDRFAPAAIDPGSLRGNALFIGDSVLPRGSEVAQPLITEINESHPALRNVNLRNVTIGTARSIQTEATAGWRFTTLLSSFDSVVLATGERRSGTSTQRIAVSGFHLAESDLPLRVAFPLLAGNLIQWLAGEPADAQTALRAGEVRHTSGSMTLSGPFTESVPAEPALGVSVRSWQPIRNGFYNVEDDAGKNLVAVNTFDAAESDLSGNSNGSPAAPLERNTTGRGWWTVLAALPPWRSLVLVAVALLLVEWWLVHRRRTE
jgi:hypothetical protein